MRRSVELHVAKRALQALTVVCLATLSLCQYGYNDDLNYYDDYQLYTAGYHYDMYDESDDGFYYNQYTGDYDDVYGDYFFEDAEETETDCRIGADSSPVFNGTGLQNWVCTILVPGHQLPAVNPKINVFSVLKPATRLTDPSFVNHHQL